MLLNISRNSKLTMTDVSLKGGRLVSKGNLQFDSLLPLHLKQMHPAVVTCNCKTLQVGNRVLERPVLKRVPRENAITMHSDAFVRSGKLTIIAWEGWGWIKCPREEVMIGGLCHHRHFHTPVARTLPHTAIQSP